MSIRTDNILLSEMVKGKKKMRKREKGKNKGKNHRVSIERTSPYMKKLRGPWELIFVM